MLFRSAIGLSLANLSFGLALATPVNTTDARSWLTVVGQADSLSVVGTPAWLTLGATNLSVKLNTGLGKDQNGLANARTVDWSQAPITLPSLSQSSSISLDLAGNVFQVAGTAHLQVTDKLKVDGTVVLSRQDLNVWVGGSSRAMSGFVLGASDVSATIAGIHVDGASLAMALLRPVNPSVNDSRSWVALKANEIGRAHV